MIRADDLREAIAECEGERSPNANTCIKLAAFLTLLSHYAEKEAPTEKPTEFKTAPAVESYIKNYGDDDFLRAISGKSAESVWLIIAELMMTLEVLNKPLHDSVMRRIDAVG